jgi:hypothetical protein
MSRTIFLDVILVALLIVGCGQSAAPEPLETPATGLSATNLPSMNGEWTIRMRHSGGIMGLARSIEISSDGKFTVMDERENKTTTGELSANELSKLNEMVSSAEYIPESKPSGGCADCFIYDLEIQTNGKNFSIQLDDISLPKSGLEPLVTYLRGLIDTALK